jgi:two-component system sensor histidine kinase CpxA
MRWPLSRKILLIALANLVLFAMVVAGFMLAQFRFGPEALLLGPAHDRILAIGNAFSLDIESQPGADHAALFASYRQRYQADFFLINPDGGTLAGPTATVPDEVIQRMRRNRPRFADNWPRDGRKKGPPREGGRKKGPPREGGRRRGPPPDGPEGMPPFREDDPPPREQAPPPRADPPPPVRAPSPEAVFLVITSNPRAYWAGARIPVSLHEAEPGTPAILLIRSTSIFNDKLFFDPRIGLGLAAALIVVSMLCWLPFIRGLTRSIAEMDRATQQIAEGRFDAQIATGRNDELGHLGRQINRLASRLESFVRNQKRFIGDIAHELCAPIARVQFALGILEQKAEPGQQAHVAVLHEEIQEMSGLVNELLSFSKAGLNPSSVPLADIDVSAVVHRAIARESVDGSTIEIAVPDGISVLGNELFLVRAIANVIRNAVRYAGKDGPITVSAEEQGEHVEIRVSDCGPGLPESELEQIFTPFYRPDDARTREMGGTGLGLAIVKTCVEACGGTVECRNRKPSGLEVAMRLSSARHAPDPHTSPVRE